MLERIKYRIIKKLAPKVYVLHEFDVDLNKVALENGDTYEIDFNNSLYMKLLNTCVCWTRQRCFDVIFDYIQDLKREDVQYNIYISDENQDHIRVAVKSDEGDKLFYIDTNS